MASKKAQKTPVEKRKEVKLEQQETEKASPTLSVTPKSIPIFFKVREIVKRAEFAGSSLEALYGLFFEKFPSIKPRSEGLVKWRDEFPLYILNREPKIPYELENLEDLYANCILEMKLPKKVQGNNSEVGFGYYAFQRQKLVFCMVGLPARGKSYIARKICRYLQWVGVTTVVFNVGSYRKQRLGSHTYEFFDPYNEIGSRQRQHIAIAALDDMLGWLNKEGRVAIYDATNITRSRREMIVKRCTHENVKVVFIESICKDNDIISKNVTDIHSFMALQEYGGLTPEESLLDFKKRINEYEKIYAPLGDEDSEYSYVQMYDTGRQITVNNIESYLPSRVIHFLMNLHSQPRPIWLSRHGQSEFNLEDRIGGDSGLTSTGGDYAHALADWVESNIRGESLTIWTSTLKRTIASAQYINHSKVALRALDEIDAGICDGMTYDEVASQMPDEYAARAANKLKYRYPQGENYLDVMQRLEPVLFELERQKNPVLLVTHQAVLRCIFAYFLDIDLEEIPFIDVKLHTVYQFTPRAYGTDVKQFQLL